MLRGCPAGRQGRLVVRRSSPKHRFRTPAAEFCYDEQTRIISLPTVSPRSKTPAPANGGHSSDPSLPPTMTKPHTLQRQANVTKPNEA
uniref:Uncharacterized protein n=1 Tax=Angiostrongylus cantonensis TaxID=6313 RepID=A0A0K0D5S8_ANGCA